MQDNYSSSQEMPIEQWNRKECEDYLSRYPRSLNSNLVRKQLERLSPKPQPPKQQKQTNIADVVESVRRVKTQEINKKGLGRYFCKNCGSESQQWFGKCPKCNAWNTCVDKESFSKTKPLSHIPSKKKESVKDDSGSPSKPKKSFWEVASDVFWGIGKLLFFFGN